MEFFQTQGNLTIEPINFYDNGKYHRLSEILRNPVEFKKLWLILLNDERFREKIKKMQVNGIINPIKQALQCIICNFLAFDSIPDIDENGKIIPEYVNCGYKGANKHCPHAMNDDPKPYCIIKFKFQT